MKRGRGRNDDGNDSSELNLASKDWLNSFQGIDSYSTELTIIWFNGINNFEFIKWKVRELS